MQDYKTNSSASFCREASMLLVPQREVIGSSIPDNTNHLSSCFSPNSSDDFTVRQHSQASFDANSPVMPSKMVSMPLI